MLFYGLVLMLDVKKKGVEMDCRLQVLSALSPGMVLAPAIPNFRAGNHEHGTATNRPLYQGE